VPSGAFIAALQTGIPEPQSIVLFTQGSAGSAGQSLPALHVMHFPPLQTDPLPQGVPSSSAVMGAHVRPPSEQTYVPFSHSLALQEPPAAQLPGEPASAPASASASASECVFAPASARASAPASPVAGGELSSFAAAASPSGSGTSFRPMSRLQEPVEATRHAAASNTPPMRIRPMKSPPQARPGGRLA
jgi:hypothetical protein